MERLRRKSLEAEWSVHLDGFSSSDAPKHLSNHSFNAIWSAIRAPCLLVLIGICSAMLSYLVNFVLFYENKFRADYINLSLGLYSYFNFTTFFFWTISLVSLSAWSTYLICPEGTGGGIGEIKTILGGVVKPVLLSKRLIVAKVLGLTFALCSLISIGKEGPFVHVSVALADQLMRLSWFRDIRNNDSRRLEILACACACGVAATFGAPFGGVMFSIELTSSVYNVKNLPRAFLTSVCGMLVYLYFEVNTDLISMFSISVSIESIAELSNNSLSLFDVAIVITVGAICGLLGVVFVKLVSFLISRRNKWICANEPNLRNWILSRRRYSIVIAAILLFMPFMYVEYMTGKNGYQSVVMETVFQPNSKSSFCESNMSHSTIILYFIYKFIFTAVSIILPLPVGLFTPIFITGGVLGRILDRLVRHCFGPLACSLRPWEFAAIGSAGLVTGASQAISTAIIVYELTGQPSIRLPVSLAILVAYFVGKTLSHNVYDVFLEENGTPIVHDLPVELFTEPVSSVMATVDQSHVLSLHSTYRDALQLLQKYEREETQRGSTSKHDINVLPCSRSASEDEISKHIGFKKIASPSPTRQFISSQVIPIVKSEKAMIIVGAILRQDLKKTLREMHKLTTLAALKPVILGENNDSEDFISTSEIRSYQSLSTLSVTYNENVYTSLPSSIAEQLVKTTSEFLTPVKPLPRLEVFKNLEAFDETIQFVIQSSAHETPVPVATSTFSSKSSCHQKPQSNTWSLMAYAIVLDTSPYQIVDTMQLEKVDTVFRLLKLNQAYVTRSGKLVGVVTRSLLREFVARHIKKSQESCIDIISRCLSNYCGVHFLEKYTLSQSRQRRFGGFSSIDEGDFTDEFDDISPLDF